MKSIHFKLVIAGLGLFLSATSFAHRGGEVGNGGDLRRFYSEGMLTQAIQALQSLKDPSCGSVHTATIYSDAEGSRQYQTMMLQIPALLLKLQTAKIEWTTDEQASCESLSEQDGKLLVRYSYLKCDWTMTGTEANRALDLGGSSLLYASFLAFEFPALDASIVTRFGLQANAHAAICYRMDAPSDSGAMNPGNGRTFPVDLESARFLAIQAVFTANPDRIQNSATTAWFLQNRSELIKDLTESEYRVVRSNPFSVCATTNTELRSPIQFSSGDCRLLIEWGGAVWLLLHETAHHLGIEDESEADEIATAIVLEASDGLKPGALF